MSLLIFIIETSGNTCSDVLVYPHFFIFIFLVFFYFSKTKVKEYTVKE